MKALITIGLTAVLFTTAAVAQTENRHFAAIGVGTVTCGVFANMYKGDPQGAGQQYFAWVQGYLSGRNDVLIANQQPTLDLGSLSTGTQLARLRAYCDQHPLGHFLEAVWALGAELKTVPPVPLPR